MNTSNPKVSIVLTVLKRENNALEAIESCINQSYQNIELIIVDSSCHQALKKLITTMALRDPRIKYIFGKSQSLSVLRNRGFRQTQGEFFMRLTSHEKLFPNAVEEMLRRLCASPSAEFIYADFCIHRAHNDQKEIFAFPEHADKFSLKRVGPCYMFSKKVYETICGYKKQYEPLEEYEFWVKVFKRFQAVHYPNPLCVSYPVPGRAKKIPPPQLALLRNVIKYLNGIISIIGLRKTIQSVFTELRYTKQGQWGSVVVAADTFLRIARMSLKTSLFFSQCLVCLALGRFFNPIVKQIQEVAQQIQIFFLKKRLVKKDKSINVLCLIPELVVGGSEKVVGDIVKGLTPLGYCFHLLGARKENNVWCQNFCRLFQNVILLSNKFKEPELSSQEEYYQYVSELVKTLHIEIVLISNPRHAYLMLPQLKFDFPAIKVVDLLHVEKFGGTSDEALPAVPFLDQRVCISHGLKEHMAERYKKAGIGRDCLDKIAVIYNGHDMKEFSPSVSLGGQFRSQYKIKPGVKIISYIGRMSPEKRPTLFVDIAKRVYEYAPDDSLLFVMVGDGPDFKSVQERIREYKLERNFILTGMVEHEKIKQLLTDSYLLLIVSEAEGLPLTAVEAMSMHVPVIGTDVGSMREVVENNVNGFLLDPQERLVESFSSTALSLVSGREFHHFLSQNTRPSVLAKFSIERMIEDYARTFRQVLSIPFINIKDSEILCSI